MVERLSSARVMIPLSWDRAPHQAPGSAGSLILPLALPLPLLLLSLSLYLSVANKEIKSLKKHTQTRVDHHLTRFPLMELEN